MPIPPTFVTPVLWSWIVSVLTGYPFFWAPIYIVSTGIYFLVIAPGSASWWFLMIRDMLVIGAVTCGWLINWNICKLWAGKKMATIKSKIGENRYTTIVTAIAVTLITGMFVISEFVEVDIMNKVPAIYPTALDAITSAYQFGWEAGLNVANTLILGISVMLIMWARKGKIQYDFRGAYSWIYYIAIIPIWPMYGLSFTRYIPGWVTINGEDWIVQLTNLGFIGLTTGTVLLISFLWRDSRKGKSRRYYVDSTVMVEDVKIETEEEEGED